ncbi:MAG: hypothetical protein WCP19_16525, partial [Chloroflexota bacterium]
NDYIDNGAGLQWDRSVQNGGTDTVSDYLAFNSQVIQGSCFTLTSSSSSGGHIEVLTAPSSSCTNGRFAAGQLVKLQAIPDEKMEFDAWTGVDQYDTSHNASVIMNSDRAVAANFSKPIVLLVHGIMTASNEFSGDICKDTAYHYSKNYSPSDENDQSIVSYFGYLPEYLVDNNFEVWIAHVETQSKRPPGEFIDLFADTPSLEFNSICLRQQIENLPIPANRKIKIISHSMGGLISRICTSSNVTCGSKVDGLMTLGTPHAGTGFITKLGFQYALYEMQPENMKIINDLYPNTEIVKNYMFIGGATGKYSPFYWGDGDTYVSTHSAAGWTDYFRNTSPENWDYGKCDPAIKNCGIIITRDSTNNEHTNYFNQGSEAYAKIDSFLGLNNHTSFLPSLQIASSSHSKIANARLSNASLSASDTGQYQTTPIAVNTLAPGESHSRTITIDTSSQTTFFLQWVGNKPAFTLTRPDGQMIDSAYAASHPDEITYSETESSIMAPGD